MIAYLDLPAGISGDMFLGCLVDAGWPVERLRDVATALGIPEEEWSIELDQVSKAGQRATFVAVTTSETKIDRRLVDIIRMIDAGGLPDGVKVRARSVFTRLATAEAKVHGTTVDRVHFHEVGAVDALIDIVGVTAGLHELGVDTLYASAVPLGSGWIKTAHGGIPLPAPATLELLATARARTRPAPGPGEWVTPTGAALLAEFATFQQPDMTLHRVGVGAGRRDCAWPNCARLWLGERIGAGGMVQLETNIDDMNPQLYGSAVDRLFAAGANDVWLTPIQMKKNRPAVTLSVLCPAPLELVVADVIFRETTTLGIRAVAVDHRHEARREVRTIETPYGRVRVKIKWLENEAFGATPEYEDCRILAEVAGVPVGQVLGAANAAVQVLLDSLRPAIAGGTPAVDE